MIITSEEPEIHWGFLGVNERVVLDLGSSKFSATKSTSQYFIEHGAKGVIGIDIGLDTEYQSPRFKMIPKCIDSSQQITDLIDEYMPEVIKSDIEGAEIHFGKIDSLPGVVEIAIEYHSNDLKNLMELKLKEWGFHTWDLHQISGIEIENMGVLHAKRIQ